MVDATNREVRRSCEYGGVRGDKEVKCRDGRVEESSDGVEVGGGWISGAGVGSSRVQITVREKRLAMEWS